MLSEQEIIDRLDAQCSEFQRDDYDEWAVGAIYVYQGILEEMGLGTFAVVDGHPNDGNLDTIIVRTPWGEELGVPDPEDIDDDERTTYEPKYLVTVPVYKDGVEVGEEPHCYIRELVLFFVKLVEGVKTLNRAQNMREAINFLEAAICAQAPTKGTPDPEERDRCMQKALLHASIAMAVAMIDGERYAKRLRIKGHERLGCYINDKLPLVFYWNEEQKEWRYAAIQNEDILGPAEPDDPRLQEARAAWTPQITKTKPTELE